MLNDFSFMGIVIKDVNFIYGEKNNLGVNLAHLRLAILQDYDIKSRDKNDAFFCTAICFGKLADYAKKFIRKKDVVSGRGHLRNSHWVSKSGDDCYSTDVVVERIYSYHFKNRKSDSEESDQNKFNSDLETISVAEANKNFDGINFTKFRGISEWEFEQEIPDNTVFDYWSK